MWLKLTIKKNRSNTSVCQFSELYLYNRKNEKVNFPSGTVVTAPNASYSSSESPDKIIDGNTNSKFCCTNFSTFSSTGLIILFELPSDISFNKYSYVTGNDDNSRDPISWVFEKSEDNVNWEIISEINYTNITTTRRAETQLWSLVSEQGEVGDNSLLFSQEQLNISNWAKNMSSFPQFENVFSSNINTLTYTGGSGYERIYTKLTVEQNKIYELHINFYSPTGFNFGGYDNVNKEQFFVMSNIPSGNCYTSLSGIIAYSENLDNAASDKFKDYIINFNSGSNTSVYLVIDFGQITDGQSKQFCFTFPLSKYDRKYLIFDNETNLYYNIVEDKLNELAIETLTADSFRTYGFDEINPTSLLLTLKKPKILYWQDSDDELPILKAKLKAIPFPKTVISSDIDISDSTITGIEKVTATYTGTPVAACSFDGGNTWKMYNGTTWALLSDGTTGMSMETMENVPSETWNSAIAGISSFKIRFTLSTAEDSVTKILVDFSN